jgi:hypothetical protein
VLVTRGAIACVLAGPTPVPVALYDPRYYAVPPAATSPLLAVAAPSASATVITASITAATATAATSSNQQDSGGLYIMRSDSPAAWLERLCSTCVSDFVDLAAAQVGDHSCLTTDNADTTASNSCVYSVTAPTLLLQLRPLLRLSVHRW